MNQSKDDNWEVVYSSDQEYKILIIQEILSENGIVSIKLNKRDSNYLFGYFELNVKGKDVMRAKLLIEKSEL